MNDLKIYQITYKYNRFGDTDKVFIAAHSMEYAIQCFKDCDNDEILYVEECLVGDGFILAP